MNHWAGGLQERISHCIKICMMVCDTDINRTCNQTYRAFKELEEKINAIADYIFNKQEAENINEDEIWVDSYKVCTFLKISAKTLQRLRVAGTITYSNIRGRYFYKIGEIKRMLEERLIRSNTECLNDLVTNHKLYRRNLRKNK